MKKNKKTKKGFTLIELIIVIALIAIIAAVVFVALDPLTRFRDARNSQRWSDVTGVLNAIKTHQVDNDGAYATTVAGLTAGQVYMIGSDGTLCDDNDGAGTAVACTTAATQDACADLSAGATNIVTDGYIGEIPTDPGATISGTTYAWDAGKTGYTIEVETSGLIHIRACLAEASATVDISR